MLVWARNDQRRLVRIVPPRNSEESIVSQLFQENPTPQMDHPESQQPLFNQNAQGIPVNPQGLHEPPQHGDGVALPATPVIGGGNVNFQRNQYRAPPTSLPNVERTLREILQPQRTITNSCIRLPEEANQFLMKSEMIRLLLVYQGVDSENPYSFMRDFEDVCSAFLSTRSPLHIICMVLFPFSLKEKAKIWFHSLHPIQSLHGRTCEMNSLTSSSLPHVPMLSCGQSKIFLKNRVNLLLLYGKDTRTSYMLSLIMVWMWDKSVRIFIKGYP